MEELSMDFTKIGNRIRNIRKNDLHMSREEFADLLNINPYAIARIERGERKTMDIEILQKIATQTGYPIDEIVNGDLINKRKNTIRRINYLLNILTEDELDYQFEAIYQFARLMHSSNDIRDLKTIKKDIIEN